MTPELTEDMIAEATARAERVACDPFCEPSKVSSVWWL
jgi:hypothetical protein